MRATFGCTLMALCAMITSGCVTMTDIAQYKQDQLSRARQENNYLRGQLQEVNGQLADSHQKLQEAKDVPPPRDVAGELAARLDEMGIRVTSNSAGALVVTLANSILFPSGSADLKSTAKSALRRVAKELRAQFPDHTVRVEGHTDNQPILQARKYKDNWELSMARALSVVRYLVHSCNMPPHEIYAAGFGMHRPVQANRTDAGRAANRRVDIVILPRIQVEQETLAFSGSH